jgi:predicted DCC family thiol-disulfide oxidoreductase YuxK
LKLYYDSSCPVCNSFAKLLRKNFDGQVELLDMPQGEQAKEFKLETDNGEFLHGKEAIDRLASEVPKIKDFFWILPDSYRGKALHKTYAFGKFIRHIFYFFRGKPCGECEPSP